MKADIPVIDAGTGHAIEARRSKRRSCTVR